MNNRLSFSSVELDLFSKEGIRLNQASGFVLESGNKYYIITNWHVLSGRQLSAQEPQEPVVEPSILKTTIHIYSGEGENSFPLSLGMRRRITVQLYDNSHAPTWIQPEPDGKAQPKADIVALPIQVNEIWRTNQAFRMSSGKVLGDNIHAEYWSRVSAIATSAIDTEVEYGPPDAVHIIGYPLGWAPEGPDRSSSAFWRTGFIASEIYEPGMSRTDAFFIDPGAPEGMTGSPVIGMKKDRIRLLGVYSDSSTVQFSANAGFVWGSWLLKELIGTS